MTPPGRHRQASDRPDKPGVGLLAAASALNRTIMSPEVEEILADFRRLNSDEARGWFADQFLTRSAGAIDRMWPIFYEMLKAVEERRLFADARYTTNRQAYGSFAEYFEDRVGRPFETWADLENTYRFVHEFRPDLFGESLKDANQARTEMEVAKALTKDLVARDAVDAAAQRPPSLHALDNIQGSAPTGTSTERALRKLRKDAPDLHAKVLAGEVTPNAAMIRAGFRRKTFTIRSDDPQSAARAIRKQMSPKDVAELADLLGGSGD